MSAMPLGPLLVGFSAKPTTPLHSSQNVLRSYGNSTMMTSFGQLLLVRPGKPFAILMSFVKDAHP